MIMYCCVESKAMMRKILITFIWLETITAASFNLTLVLVTEHITEDQQILLKSAESNGLTPVVLEAKNNDMSIHDFKAEIESRKWADDDVILITNSGNYHISSPKSKIAAQVAYFCLLHESLMIAADPKDTRSPFNPFDFILPEEYVIAPSDFHINNTLEMLENETDRTDGPLRISSSETLERISVSLATIKQHRVLREQFLRKQSEEASSTSGFAFAGSVGGIKQVFQRFLLESTGSKSLEDLHSTAITSADARLRIGIGLDQHGSVFYHSRKSDSRETRETKSTMSTRGGVLYFK